MMLPPKIVENQDEQVDERVGRGYAQDRYRSVSNNLGNNMYRNNKVNVSNGGNYSEQYYR